MPTIAELNQRHDSIDVERREDLRALYEGGQCFEKRINRFLLQRPAETDGRYSLRRREAHYENYLGTIIDYFTAMLFTSRPAAKAKSESGEPVEDPGAFYEDFRQNCDGNGQDLDAFMKARLTEAMTVKCSWFAVVAPDGAAEDIRDRKTYEARKLGDCWVRDLPCDSVLDWETDDFGALEWVVVHSAFAKRTALAGGRKSITERWEHFLPDRTDVYELTYDSDKKPDPVSTDVPLVSDTAHRFGQVPVICLELPTALHAAERIASPALGHFRMSNAQTWSMTATCYAMLVNKVRDPEAFNDAQKKSGAGYERTIYTDEDIGWVAPEASHFSALDVQIKAFKDEIFRLAHQMALGVENNAAAVGRTAESKVEDSKSTRIILLAYAKVVKECIERLYDMLERVRGDSYEWSIEGLDEYAGIGLGGMLDIFAKLQTVGGIPSRTLLVEARKKWADELFPDLDETIKATVNKEIEESTKEVLDETPAEAETRMMFEQADKLNQVTTKPNAGSEPKPGTVGPGSGPGPKGPPRGNRNGARAAAPVA